MAGEAGTDRQRVRITQQFRQRQMMVYELDSFGERLTVRVSPSEQDAWTIEARTSDSAEAAAVSASAPTRAQALAAVARSWAEKVPEVGLPTFDWDAIHHALAAVRAV